MEQVILEQSGLEPYLEVVVLQKFLPNLQSVILIEITKLTM